MLTRRIVGRLNAAMAAPLPEEVARAARLHFLDAVGVGLAASRGAVGAAYRGYAGTLAAAPGVGASIFGMGGGFAPQEAALVNGGLIHSLEYDDTHTASIIHGGAVLAAVSLAAAEASDATPEALLKAYALGWELLIRFGLAAPGGFQRRGFHTTSAVAPLAGAWIAAALSGLDEDRMVAAMGIALSQSSGVFEFLSNGSSVKSLHPGWAAHAGIIAAAMAAHGMSGPETAIEGRYGLFRMFTDGTGTPPGFNAMVEDLGRAWHLPAAAFKFYPCCHYIHPFVEAAGRLAEEGVSADTIAVLLCRVPEGAAPVICDPWEDKLAPPTPHAARWSLPVAVAARFVDGRVDLDTFEKPFTPAVLDLARRMRWETLEGSRFPEQFDAEIVCTLADGTTRAIRIEDVYGNASRPAGEAEIRAKFRANASLALGASGTAGLEGEINALGGGGDATSLSGLIAALRRVTAT